MATTTTKKAPKKVVKKAEPKKATRNTTLRSIELTEYSYYSALYNGKRIRGQVLKDRYDDIKLLNNQGAGEEECTDDNEGYTHSLSIENLNNYLRDDYEQKTDFELLENSNVTNFRIITDSRAKKIIDADKLPAFAGYGVKIVDKQTIGFGCGAVEVSLKELKDYLTVKKALAKVPEKVLKSYYTILVEISKEDDLMNEVGIKVSDVEKLVKYYEKL